MLEKTNKLTAVLALLLASNFVLAACKTATTTVPASAQTSESRQTSGSTLASTTLLTATSSTSTASTTTVPARPLTQDEILAKILAAQEGWRAYNIIGSAKLEGFGENWTMGLEQAGVSEPPQVKMLFSFQSSELLSELMQALKGMDQALYLKDYKLYQRDEEGRWTYRDLIAEAKEVLKSEGKTFSDDNTQIPPELAQKASENFPAMIEQLNLSKEKLPAFLQEMKGFYALREEADRYVLAFTGSYEQFKEMLINPTATSDLINILMGLLVQMAMESFELKPSEYAYTWTFDKKTFLPIECRTAMTVPVDESGVNFTAQMEMLLKFSDINTLKNIDLPPEAVAAVLVTPTPAP